jgi:hypothetical protein
VLSIAHDPIVDRQRGRTLSQVMGWFDWRAEEAQYIRDVADASHGLLLYDVVDRRVEDAFPRLVDGFRYDAASFLRCWQRRSGFHQPEGADYRDILDNAHAAERVDAGEIDEVWLFGFPYCGYYESMMVGPGSFWCNAPPMSDRCGRKYVVMGFNFEREVGCMLENLGHRAESIMSHVYRDHPADRNHWERFTRYDRVAPGHASCGNVHFAPNSTHDYDWGNPRPVSSDCDDWLTYPRLTGARRTVTCRDWGNGDMRAHHLWWFERIPHADGQTDRVANNWWRYIGDPNTVV